ncbi:efflux RND transporter periplasmic adaptor subunit [Aliiroseovarius subalbicans]|uniref:efflux RND transporter periplasmic adaptor subunit n=1 Tax=Aliiroseovarius subalbicans TaxID=2925840 RepID=UPI001F5781EE|nr:efflux RND transporter periplasmic adaptor subunit [Aliiroseovarius subalbicans]MCI2399537.1 efflux RND transporter periplasmic adaptor subunit [Aliiroseovarius subalbicans]
MGDTQREIEATLGVGHAKRRVPHWVWWVLAILVAIGVTMWWMQEVEERRAVHYVTEEVVTGDLTITVTATGTVEPTNLVEISTEISGTMAEVLVDFNDTVQAGQVLAMLDTTQLNAQLSVQKASHAAAAAQLTSAEASLTEARLNFETVQQLDQRGVTSRTNVTAAQAALDRARANVASAQANLDLAQAQLDAQQAELAKATIHAPIDGIVLRRDVDAGQIVAASLSAPELFTIAEDLAQMELQVDVSEADIGRIAVGDIASFTVDAYDDQTFPATISMVRFASDNTDGLVTYKAILSVANDDLLLRPGMTATADITVARHEQALLVPNGALRFAPPQVVEEKAEENEAGGGLLALLIPDNEEDNRVRSDRSVWVLRDGVALEVSVEKGDTDGQMTQILSGDIVVGDQVITDMIEGK